MNRIVNWLAVLFSTLVFLINGCANISRGPSSVTSTDDQKIDRVMNIDLSLAHFWSTSARQKNEAENRKLSAERDQLTSEISSNLKSITWSGVGPWREADSSLSLFTKEEAIEITNWNDFKLNRLQNHAFPLEHRFYSSYTLRFDNLIPPFPDSTNSSSLRYEGNPYLKAQLECNGNIIYDDGFLFFKKENRSKIYRFNWYYNKTNGERIKVRFSPEVTRCQFKYYDPYQTDKWTNGFDMVEISSLNQQWKNLTKNIQICLTPTANLEDAPTNFFWRQDFPLNTCVDSIDKWINLKDPYASMNSKILALTGSPLKRIDFDRKNPMADLDFSKAPKFDVIWISSLQFSADFYGYLIARALRYHAEQGTQIRLIISEVTAKEKDKNMINWLMRDTPNVKVEYYRYDYSDQNAGTLIDQLHRVNHTKVILGYSTANESHSFLITGGRNIRDSYIFKKKPFHKKYKFLKNYGDGEENYIYYDDFEMEMRGPQFVKSVLTQMLSFWMRENESQRLRNTNINIKKDLSAEETQSLSIMSEQRPLVRHIISAPFSDRFKLEQYYTSLIDSAQSELLITTPYFRPSAAINAALDRAAKRKVKISIITRIHLAGDDVPPLAEDVNKEGINRHYQNIDMYEWTESNSILHAKLLVIDNKLSFVGSVNLNRRSFLHDTENGVLILHKPTALEVRKVISDYIKKSRKLTTKEKVPWINSTLIDWADDYF